MAELPITSAASVMAAWRAHHEIALLDVRTEADYATGHPLFAASFPLDRLEQYAEDRLPCRDVSVVVYDAGTARAHDAVTRLVTMGFSDVALLEGGLDGWRDVGGELFADVNSPSKAFGELVAESRATPMIDAPQLRRLLDDGADVAVVDIRPSDEYATMHVPTARHLPGVEIVHRLAGLVRGPDTLVVLNCAGRTRGIIATQSLANAGFPNSVVALRDGTIGWQLAGLALDHGSESDDAAPSSSGSELVSACRALADRAGVVQIGSHAATPGDAVPGRTVYRFDVRTADEYLGGHLSGFEHAPGGQLLQETDVFAPVRGAVLVVCDDDTGRADLTAHWLAQMGWDVHSTHHRPDEPDLERGARERAAPPVANLTDAYRRPYVGKDVDPAVMQDYLDWEAGLVAQLERDGTHHFFVLDPD